MNTNIMNSIKLTPPPRRNVAMGFIMTEVFTLYLLWSHPAAVASGGGESEGSGSCTYSLAAE